MFHLHETGVLGALKTNTKQNKTKPRSCISMLRTHIFSETVSLKPHLHLGPSCNNPTNSSSELFCGVVILPGSPRSPLHTDLLARVFTLVSFFFFFSSSFPRSRSASSLFFLPQRISAASCRQDTFFQKKKRNRSVLFTRPAGGCSYECNLCVPPPRHL